MARPLLAQGMSAAQRLPALLAAALFAAALSVPSFAADAPSAAAPFEGPPTFTLRAPVITRHTGVFNGKKVSYVATVDGIDVADSQGHHGARLVAFAYTAESVAGRKPERAQRPVMFFFNGGPIVPSAYLHMGSFGPKRVVFPAEPSAKPFTWEAKENPYSLLDVADLVFIDPAMTGFSRVAPGKNAAEYFSVTGDGQQVTAFIDAWLRRNGRMESPKYIFGESYGTMRAVEVGRQLAALPQPVLLSGTVLFGQAVNIAEYVQRPRNILSYVLSLPTLAAIAAHHHKVELGGRTLEQFIQASREFARDEYLGALYRGNTLSADERARVAARLQEYSGIPAAYYVQHDLRISKETFRVELLKEQGLLLGRSDARYAAPMTPKANAADPSDVLPGALQDAFRTYLRQDLGVDWDEPYVFSSPVGGLDGWGWGGTSPFSDWPYVDSISELMKKNPKFRVMLGSGYYDTQTTLGGAEYAATQSGWPRDRTILREYPGGHMAYSIDATARQLADDLRAFIAP